ncbi:MAG: DNA helicase, partial [Roseomonas sp.]|nr:DNA helicase [Roseomonas sp.]
STQQQAEWCPVSAVTYRAHAKPEKPTSLRVSYQCGLTTHNEWVCFEHTGYPRTRAEAWWRRRTDAPIPGTVDDALAMVSALREPVAIQVKPVGKYTELVGFRFGGEA